MDETLVHDCAWAASAALCDSMFSERDEAWTEMFRTVFPYLKAAVETYVEMSPGGPRPALAMSAA